MEELVDSLDPTLFVAIIGFIAAAAGIFLFAGLHARRHAAVVKATETSPIGFAQDGYRQIEGTVEAPDSQTLTAPLTQAPVCWYRAKVERRHAGRRDMTTWRVERTMASSAPFLLRDATGACSVHPLGSEVTPTDRSVWYGSTPEPEDRNPPRLGPADSPPILVMEQQYRYTEERIYGGDPAFVLGLYRSGRFTGQGVSSDAPDGDDEEANGAASEDRGAAPVDEEDDIERPARQATRASIRKGGGKPFIICTTPRAVDVTMSEYGGQLAIYMALGALGLAALLVWVRLT